MIVRLFNILLLVLAWMAADCVFAQEEKEQKTATEAEASADSEEAESSGDAEKKEENEVEKPRLAAAPEKKKTPEEMREEMLEKLADHLSHRMRSLKDREAALSAREEALADREKEMLQRERSLSDLEEMMQMREDVVKRREQLPPPQSWNGPDAPSVYAQYAAVIDGETMQFYFKKNAESHTPVASTQKLMTALVVCHEGNLDKMATVPEIVNSIEPTKIGVKPGETYSRRQLLTSLLVRSGNDIAATLAIDNAGSIEAFARKMNAFARHIGMTNSNFVNPHGLPAEGQYSCARDIAIAAFEAYQLPEIRRIVKTKTYNFVFNDGSEYMLYNTNKILGVYEGCNGMKTGYTFKAGNCLVSSACQNGEHRISVMIKSARPNVYDDSKAILDWSIGLEKTGPLDGFAGVR